MARMVCLWLPNWPTQRLRHEQPELKGRAVVLFSTTGSRGPRVVTCSSAAAQHGVTAGMPLAEAQALMTGSPANAHFERHDPAADITALRNLAQTCDRFSPQFGIEEADAPECVLLDIAGCSHLWASPARSHALRGNACPDAPRPLRDHSFDVTVDDHNAERQCGRSHAERGNEIGEQNLADAIASNFRQQGFQVRVAIAPTIGAAWVAAHCLAKPDRQPVLSDGDLANSLAPLPVTALRLSHKTVETLHELGLRCIGQLQALPRDTLPSRFEPELLKRLDQAFGDSPELLVAERPAEPLAVTWVTDEPLTDRESLRFVCRELTDQLLSRLKPRRDGVRQLFCQVKGTAARPVELLVNLVCPSDSAKHLLELFGLQIDRADLPEGISFVRLEATVVASLATRQRDLFGLEEDANTHREVNSLLDRLSNRLGATAVVHAALVADAQPELSVSHEPVAYQPSDANPGSESSTRRRSQPDASAFRLMKHSARPLRLFDPPQRIEATAAGPEGAPMHFRWDRHEYRVIRSWGPERIESGWWRGESVCRDYFRVEVLTGQHFWLFRSFEQSAWFIHGAFD